VSLSLKTINKRRGISMRIILSLLVMLSTAYSTNAGDLNNFKLMFLQVKNNYKTALLTSSPEQKRDYTRLLGNFKSAGSEIGRNLTRYKRYDEINDMNISQACNELISQYNMAKSRPEHYASYAKGFSIKAGSGAPTDALRSVSEVEATRRGALFLLGKWINQLDEYDYPDIKVPNNPPAVKYSLLLNQFKLGVKVLRDEKGSSSSSSKSSSSKRSKKSNNKPKNQSNAVSEWVKDDVRRTFRRFSKAASSLQKEGMRRGFSVSKYVSRVNTYIESIMKLNRFLGNNQAGKEVRDDYNYAMSKLEEFGKILADSPTEDTSNSESDDREDTFRSEAKASAVNMLARLREHREEIIDNDPSMTGLSYEAETITNYLRTLSRAEYAKYKSTAKDYIRKKYSVERAKTTAIKQIHSYTKANKITITFSELTALVDKLGLEMDAETSEEESEEVTPQYDRKTRNKTDDQVFQELKILRSTILKMNTNISGRATSNSSISLYEKTLSQKEKERYKKLTKQYGERDYGDQAAKSSAINLIHSLFVSRSIKISEDEMISILEKTKKLLEKLEEN